jgi:hypothetical protein
MKKLECCPNMRIMNRDKVIVVSDKVPFSNEQQEPTAYVSTKTNIGTKTADAMYRIKFCPACGKEIKL